MHQQPSGYEPGALLLSYGPRKWSDTPVLPRAPPVSKTGEFAGSLVSEKLDVRPRLALGNAALQAADSALCLAHDGVKVVPSAGSAPAPLRSQRRMLLLHYEGNGRAPVGFSPKWDVSKEGGFLFKSRGIVDSMKVAEHQRIALWTPCQAQRFSGPFPRLCRTCSILMKRCPHQDLHLEPLPLEAAYALSITPCGQFKRAVETGAAPAISSLTRRRVC